MEHQRTVYGTVLEQGRRHPDRVAVVDRARLLTYAQLGRAVDGLAASLLDTCSVGDRVGVLVECSAATVVAYFACQRAGMVYTPLFDAPVEVLRNLAERVDLAALIADRSLELGSPQIHPDATSEVPAAFPQADPTAPAHLLLTSGTATGRPKAVATDQMGSLLSHDWRTALCPFERDDVVGCNVFGIWDVVPALQHGVPAVMIPDSDLRDPAALAGVIVRHAVTRIMLTPSLLGACLSSPVAVTALAGLRLIVLCGEIAKAGVLRQAGVELPHTRLLNLYSISECHDVAAGFVGDGESRLWPAAFADVRVVDPADRDRPQRAGAAGRIVVGGPGVAPGYVDQASDRFFETGGRRCFDTGDLGVLDQAGGLTVVGRADARTKVRGRWVDPAQIEAEIAGHRDVVDVSVTVRDGRILAAVVGRGADLVPDLSDFLAERLPAHAVPDRIERVDRLGLSASGKATGPAHSGDGAAAEMPVLQAFREVLGDRAIQPDDDFVELGGTSIDAIELCGRLQQLTGYPLRVEDLYARRRPRDLAPLLQRRDAVIRDWRLPGEVPRIVRSSRARRQGTVLLTGASGFLGRAVADALGPRRIDLRRPAMDLDQPLLGLSGSELEELAGRIDRIVHVAARVDPFADFESLYRTNVQGTVELIRLAGIRGVPMDYVSSSAVLPLGAAGTWTPDTQPSATLADALRASGADAYSFTKLGAEIALWRAAGKGLPVRIVRAPHVLGHPRRDRLLQTLVALRAAGVYPDGPWQWQFVRPGAVAAVLVATPMEAREIRHVALPPLAVADVVRHLGLNLRPVPMAAIATALAQVDAGHPRGVLVKALRQLVIQHGPAAALCMNEAVLSDGGGDPLPAFAEAFDAFEAGSDDAARRSGHFTVSMGARR